MLCAAPAPTRDARCARSIAAFALRVVLIAAAAAMLPARRMPAISPFFFQLFFAATSAIRCADYFSSRFADDAISRDFAAMPLADAFLLRHYAITLSLIHACRRRCLCCC